MRALCLLSLLVFACSEKTKHIALPTASSDLFYAVKIGRNGAVKEVLRTEGITSVELENQPLIEASFVEEYEKIILIGLALDELATELPAYDQTRISELRLRARQDRPVEGEIKRIELSPSLVVMEYVSLTGEFVAAADNIREGLIRDLVFSVPVNFDYCRNKSQELLQPVAVNNNCTSPLKNVFHLGSDAYISSVESGFLSVTKIGEARDCSRSSTSSQAIQRQRRPFEDDDAKARHLQLAVSSVPLIDGDYKDYYRVVVIGRESNVEGQPVAFHVEEYAASSEGLSPVLSSIRINVQVSPFDVIDNKVSLYVAGVLFDEQNQLIISFTKGVFATQRPGEEEFSYVKFNGFQSLENAFGMIRAVDYRIHETSPHLLNTDRGLYVGHINSQAEWKQYNFDEIQLGMRGGPGLFGPEEKIFLTGTALGKSWLMLADKDNLRELVLEHSARMSACFVEHRLVETRRMVADDEALYVLSTCNGVLRMRFSDSCTTFLNFEKEPTYNGESYPVEKPQTGPLGMSILDKSMLVISPDGVLYEANLRSFDRP